MNFDLSTIANWLGVITAAATLLVWTWKLVGYFRRQLTQVRADALLGERLAQDLASKATNAERRSDIYTYFTLRALRTIARRQISYFVYLGTGAFFTALLFYGKTRGFVPLAIDAEWRAWVHNGFMLLLVLAIAALVLTDRVLRKLENGWQSGVDKALSRKLAQHSEA